MTTQAVRNLHVLYGRDDYLIEQRARELAGPVDPGLGDLNRRVFEGDRLPAAMLREAVEALPFLAEQRVTIVRGLLGKFDGGQRSKARTEDSQNYADAVAAAPPSSLIIFVEGDIHPDKNLLAGALRTAGAAFTEFRSLNHDQLLGWIKNRAAERGVKIADPAVRRLAGSVGANLWAIEQEIDKLATYAAGAAITEDDVKRLVSASNEESAFALADAILEGRGRDVLHEIDGLVERGESPFGVFALIQSKARQLWLLREMLDAGAPALQMQQRTGLIGPRGWLFRQTLDAARRFPAARYRRLHARLLEVDQSVKTGKQEPQLALELLAIEVSSSPGSRR